MINALYGKKLSMSQAFVEGTRIPITWVKAGPCVVTQVKSKDSDGYWAVQLGYDKKKIKNTSKALKGHLRGVVKKEKLAPRFLGEVRLDKKPDYKVGDEVKLTDIFKKGDLVSVSGVSKGKGFAGVVKRWRFAGGPRTHGQSDRLRAPGSIGQGTDPGRVHKGKKMPGRMGTQKTTVKNLVITEIDADQNRMAISGLLPGPIGNLLLITKTASGKLDELVREVPEPVPQVEVEEEGDKDKTKAKKEEDKKQVRKKEEESDE